MKGFQSGAEVTSPRFIYGIKAARAMDRVDSRYLSLSFDIAGGEAKLWCDSVYRSLVFHDKMLFEKESERSESGA